MAPSYDPAVFARKMAKALTDSEEYQKGAKWDPMVELPDLTGKVAIVTGAYDPESLGYHIAFPLAMKGARVYVNARSLEKAQSGIQAMKVEAGDEKELDLRPLVMDLSSLEQARDAAKQVLEKETRLDILVNNAATTRPPSMTVYGVNDDMIVNHVAPFLFTLELLPLIKATHGARIVNVASIVSSLPPTGIQLKTIKDLNQTMGEPGSQIDVVNRLGLAKLCNILFSNELQHKFDEEGVAAITLSPHPGTVHTTGHRKLSKDSDPSVTDKFITPAQGALSPLFAAAHPEVWERREEYAAAIVFPYKSLVKKEGNEANVELAKNLWKISEEVIANYRS